MTLDKPALLQKYEEFKAKKLKLNIERGQPSDANFDLSNPMLTIITEKDVISKSGFDLRNYPGGPLGLPEAREFFSSILEVSPEETIVGNNASLEMLTELLMIFLIHGNRNSSKPWIEYKPPKMIVTVPGYDRHFKLLQTLGFEMIQVNMTSQGPDIDAIEKIAAEDETVKGLLFVPTYSNPTGDVVADEAVDRLASMKTKAVDFSIFGDDAYCIHHIYDNQKRPKNLLKACKEAGNPDRAIILSSTSKITFAGAGVGFIGLSAENVKFLNTHLSAHFITPNKIEQYRNVKFIQNYPGGIDQLMKDHAKILRPKYELVNQVLTEQLGESDLANWTKPKGGYFISLNTKYPVADRVVDLVKSLGVALTPAGATYPFGKDPANSNIRIAPTRPPLEELRPAIEVLALCIQIASWEYGNKNKIVN